MQLPGTFTSSVERFIKTVSGRNLSGHTATAYQTDLGQFLTWLIENDVTVVSPAQITRNHVLDYLSHLAGLGRSGVTRARKLASIREYCKFLVAEKSISSSPAENIGMPKKERKQRVFLRVDEYMRLLNAAAGNGVPTFLSPKIPAKRGEDTQAKTIFMGFSNSSRISREDAEGRMR